MTFFWLRLAARTLLRRRARSGITLAAIALGVASLTFLGSLMVGVNDSMIANSISLHTGNILVESADDHTLITRWRNRSDLPHQVTVVMPRLIVPAMLVTPSGAAPVQVVGVLPERENVSMAVPSSIVSGSYLFRSAADNEIVIGKKAADLLSAKAGSHLTIRLRDGRDRSVTVAGIFRTGIDRFDEGMAYMHLDKVAGLNDDAARGEVAILMQTGLDRRDTEDLLRPFLDEGEVVSSWQVLLPELEQLLRLNVVSMTIVIILVAFMMAAGVSNTLLVSVMDRYREFGVLKALGTTPGEIVWLIVIESVLICLAAGIAGFLVGETVILAFGHAGIDLGQLTSENPHFVLNSVVYPRLTLAMAVMPALTVLALSVLASFWPAIIAARRQARDVMRLSM